MTPMMCLARVATKSRGSGVRVNRCGICRCRSLPTAPVAPEPSKTVNGNDEAEASGITDDIISAHAANITPVITSLALSVHFRHPDFGMKDFEILSRGTAFLLQVDPPDSRDSKTRSSVLDSSSQSSLNFAKNPAFPHLKDNMDIRKKLLLRQDYKYDPASGPPRLPHQLNWLEFCPTAFRPKVHIAASSHVISPWLWPKYYAHDWLRSITKDHVRYSLEVWGKKSSNLNESNIRRQSEKIYHEGRLPGNYKPLAKFALNPYPIHHPAGLDIAVIHMKQEDTALDHLQKLGVQPLHLPTMHELEMLADPVFEPGEHVLFQGFEVYEANTADQEKISSNKLKKSNNEQNDERMFHPYSSLGTLAWNHPDRFLAKTKAGLLPEGLCGGPVIQLPKKRDGGEANTLESMPLTVRGIVEGIVPANYENEKLAGMAAFHPSYRVREFVDYAEQIMLQAIVGDDLFQKIVNLKERKVQNALSRTDGAGHAHKLNPGENGTSQNGRKADLDDGSSGEEVLDDPNIQSALEGTGEDHDTPHIDSEYQRIVASLHKNHTQEEVDAILATVEREREEVIKIMETEGGDVDDAIEVVRKRTYYFKDRILKEIEKGIVANSNSSR